MAMNPFKPTAGKMPPILIGRETAIEEFTEGLDNGAGAPGRIMLVTGQRGFGKTVLLTEFRRIAAERGWETISETASPDVAQRLIEALTPSGLHINQASVSPSVSIPGIASASLGHIDLSSTTTPLTLRNAIAKRLESGKIGKGKGILITIDETQAASLDDLVAIATAIQHVTTSIDETNVPDAEKKGIAIVFAGLPSTVNDLVNDDVVTFLRRALRCELDNVPLVDVKNAFLESVADSGKTRPGCRRRQPTYTLTWCNLSVITCGRPPSAATRRESPQATLRPALRTCRSLSMMPYAHPRWTG